MSEQTPTPAPGPSLSGRAWLLLMLAVVTGVGLAGYLVSVKLRLEFDPGYASSCNFGDTFNCDLVQTSEHSMVFGRPLALWGLATYLLFGILATVARRSMALGRSAHGLLAIGGIVACIHTVYLAYISTVVIGAYCLFCIGMYAVNLLVAVTATLTYRRRHGRLLDVGALLSPPKAPLLAGLYYALAITLALLGYNNIYRQMRAERIETAKAEMTGQMAAPGMLVASTGSQSKSQGTAPVGPGRFASGKMGLELTRKGRSYYEVPVTDQDWVMGPADAPVTIVEFADFECGYCRMLTRNLKPLKAKYKGKVRWVFKHFPLDHACNPRMKGNMHKKACLAARASNCAGEQGKFWPMHDQLYANNHQLEPKDLRKYAVRSGADALKYDACMAKPGPDARIVTGTRQGAIAKLNGTPRMYVNGHLVPGVQNTDVMDYYIRAAMDAASAPAPGAEQVAVKDVAAPPTPAGAMRPIVTAKGTSYIDAYEASIDAKGRAISKPGVVPAQASFIEATAACQKAGKRLCTEEEWVSSCTGTPAVDNDKDGFFGDDDVEGQLFPYGAFHTGGTCHDNEKKRGGKPRATGSFPKCRDDNGVYDQSGNVAEWTGLSEGNAVLSGNHFSTGAKATCLGRYTTFGTGYRNYTTGFRCCADTAVSPPEAAAVVSKGFAEPGKPAPAFSATTSEGKLITDKVLKGKVTIVTFFASWCHACKRELPMLQTFYTANKSNPALQILAIGVDTKQATGEAYIKTQQLDYTIAYDPKAESMGQFGVKAMPTSFLVDRSGKVTAKLVGINKKKMAVFKDKTRALLNQGG